MICVKTRPTGTANDGAPLPLVPIPKKILFEADARHEFDCAGFYAKRAGKKGTAMSLPRPDILETTEDMAPKEAPSFSA